ncbi:MAG: hypothetical protein QOI63_474, partial [Thermoplasmata archaeon]|nr:hypothetical protein [Thermoplasmata archaeon]
SFSVAAFSGGSHTVAVRFAGIAGVAGTAQEAPLLVQAATLVRLPNLHLGPGGSTPFQGSLSDAGGRGVAGQVIHLALGKQPLPDVLTASNGLFNARVDLPADAPLGVLELTARFDGSLNKTFGPASAGAPLVVGSALRFEAPHAVLARGNNTITAQLVEQASGRGVEGVTVQAEVPGQPAHSEATDASGAFHVPVPVRDGRPGGDVVVHFAYPGDAVRGAADQDIAIPFAPATRIAALVPEEAGRGTDITVRALLVDDAGNRFAGTVSGAFLGLAQSAASDAQGRANLTFHVPADAAFGPATLTLGHAGDAHHAAASRSDPVAVKGGVRLLVDDLPAVVEPRAPLLVRFRAIDEEGHPVAGKPASVRLQGEGSAVLVQTDADGVATAALPAPARGAFEIVVGVAGSPQQAAASASSFLHVRSASAAAVPVTGALLLAGAGLALAAAAIVAFTLRRRGRIAAVLHRAAGSLQAGDPWAGGILLAYQGLSDALGRRGVQEQPGQSIRDFVSAVVAATRIPEDTAIDFVRLVEKARYAGQANRLEDALDARRVLARMVAVLEGAA